MSTSWVSMVSFLISLHSKCFFSSPLYVITRFMLACSYPSLHPDEHKGGSSTSYEFLCFEVVFAKKILYSALQRRCAGCTALQ